MHMQKLQLDNVVLMREKIVLLRRLCGNVTLAEFGRIATTFRKAAKGLNSGEQPDTDSKRYKDVIANLGHPRLCTCSEMEERRVDEAERDTEC